MDREQHTYLDLYDKFMHMSHALDEYQAALDKHRGFLCDVLGEDQVQAVQNDIDVKRIDIELDLLVIRAKLSE